MKIKTEELLNKLWRISYDGVLIDLILLVGLWLYIMHWLYR